MKDVAAAGDHTCALMANGQVQCWGENTDGEVGNAVTLPGTYQATLATVGSIGQSGGLAPARALSLGYFHSCAALTDGTATCWGNDLREQLGNGNAGSTFSDLAAPDPTNGVALDAGTSISTGGHVAAGGYHACGLAEGGTVKCWGLNTDDDVSGTASTESTPYTVASLPTPAIDVCAGYQHTCALLGDGTVYCWGDNSMSQLARTGVSSSSSPGVVSGLSNVVQITCSGGYHTCALIGDGTLQCWGNNASGQLGDGSTTTPTAPQLVTNANSSAFDLVRTVAAGGYHTCAAKLDGTLYCWGDNGVGAVGDGTTTQRDNPVNVSGVEPRALGLGVAHSCVIQLDGSVACWGDDQYGGLGDGTNTSSGPVVVSSPVLASSVGASYRVVAIAAGAIDTCAQMGDGTAACWGYDGDGQLGNGSTSTSCALGVVSGLPGVTSIAGGYLHTCATDANGAAWCWGYDADGELGTGSTSASSVPVEISGTSYP